VARHRQSAGQHPDPLNPDRAPDIPGVSCAQTLPGEGLPVSCGLAHRGVVLPFVGDCAD